MTNDEVNIAIARKLGWEWTGHKEPNCWMPPQEWKFKQTGIFMVPMPLQNYCTDIAAAWEIVELPGIGSQCVKRTIYPQPSWEWMLFKDGYMVMAEADTAPMAICLAFLKFP